MKNKILIGIILLCIGLIAGFFIFQLLDKDSFIYNFSDNNAKLRDGFFNTAIWGYSNTNLSNGLIRHYKLNDNLTTTNIIDSQSINNATLTVNTRLLSSSGKINNSIVFNGTEQINANFVNLTTGYTYSFWINQNVDGENMIIWNGLIGGGDNSHAQAMFFYSSGTLAFRQGAGDSVTVATATTSLTPNTWTHIIGVYNGTQIRLYKNGLSVSNVTGLTNVWDETGGKLRIGQDNVNSSGWGFNGSLDDVRIYNRSLTANEVLTLYNSGSGTEETSSGWVTLNSPADSSTQYTSSVTFNASANVVNTYLSNMSLWDNSSGSWAKVNESGILINTNKTADHGETIDSADGTGTWKVGMAGNFTGEVYIFNITKNAGTTATKAYIQTSYGGGVLATTNFSGDTATFSTPIKLNATTTYYFLIDANGGSYALRNKATALPITSENFTWWRSVGNGGTLEANNIKAIELIGYNITVNSTTQIASTQTFTQSYSSGQSILWNVQACDSDGDCGFALANKTFRIDSVTPQITFNYPTSLINYGKINGILQLNFTATDSNNLDDVWYNYNGTNITIPGALTGVYNISNITLSTKKNVTIYANDTAGNLNTTTFSWNYRVFETDLNYTAITNEGATENFESDFTVYGGYKIDNAYLVYDSVFHAASISNDFTHLSKTITIPNVDSTSNKSWYWQITLNDSTQINTTSSNQTINTLGIDNCSVYTNELFNFTIYDEETQALLNATSQATSIKVSFTLKNLNGSLSLLNYSYNFNQENPARVCLQNSLNDSSYRLDGIVEYSSTGRFTEFYNFQNHIIDNSTDETDVFLYNLNSTNGQEFKITYKDSNFVPVSNAIFNIQRKYIDEGVFKTTEIPKSNIEGYVIGHLVRSEVIYNIIIMKEGSVLATFTDIVADCQNPALTTCQINLNSYGSSNLPTDFTNANDITFTLSYNKTSRIVSSIFAIVSGVTSSVSLNVTLFDGLGNTSICSDQLYSSGGQLNCVVPSSFGNATIIAILYKDSEPIGQAIIKIKQDPSDIYGGSIIFISMLMFVVIIGFGASSDNPMIMGIVLVIGSIVLVSLNMIYTPSFVGVGATILWFIVAVVIVLIKGSNRS